MFWDGNVLDDSKIYQSGQMLFEGLAHGADPTDGTSGHLASTEAITALAYKTFPLPYYTRSSDRWTYGAKDMGMFCHMVLKKIEELHANFFEELYEKRANIVSYTEQIKEYCSENNRILIREPEYPLEIEKVANNLEKSTIPVKEKKAKSK